MLKRLGDLLDDVNAFTNEHETFATVTVIVAGGLLVCALIVGMIMLGVASRPDHSDVLWEGTVTLSDTRRVHCIATDDGLSCDWTHADGGDNL